MFKVGDHIVYGNSGVCKLLSIGPHQIEGFDPERLYYALEPVHSNGVIYAPLDTKVQMRLVLSFEAARTVINSFSINPIQSLEQQELVPKNLYESLIESGDPLQLADAIKIIYIKNSVTDEVVRKMGGIDLRYLKIAEERLFSELSVSLNSSIEEVKEQVKPLLLALVEQNCASHS